MRRDDGSAAGRAIGLRWTDVDWVASRVRVAESYTRGAFDSPKSKSRPLGADGRPSGRRARAALPALALRHPDGRGRRAAEGAIQEWMGHADASTTEIYPHYAPDPTHGAAFAEGVRGSWWLTRRGERRAVAAGGALTALVGDPALEVGP